MPFHESGRKYGDEISPAAKNTGEGLAPSSGVDSDIPSLTCSKERMPRALHDDRPLFTQRTNEME